MKNLLKNIWALLVVIALFLSTVLTVEAVDLKIKRRGAGISYEEDIILPNDWFKPYEVELRNPNLCWVAVKSNKKAGWFEEYKLKTENICISINYGKTEKGISKVAFNASFSKNQPPLYFWLYFEGSVWTYGNSSSRIAFTRLIQEGVFSKKELSQNIQGMLNEIHPAYLTVKELDKMLKL